MHLIDFINTIVIPNLLNSNIMNILYHARTYILSAFLYFTFSFIALAQVGIGNTSPNPDALLDVGTDTSTAGLRLPRVALTGTANFAPLSAHVQGMTVYNTVVTSDVIEGYYYNDGTKWILIASEDWKILGNTGTSQTVNFVGTTDNVGLTFRTNNLQRFRMNTNDQLLAIENGSAAAPSYSWGNDTSMGFYKSGNRQMDMVINGTSFYNANRVGSTNFEWTFNPGGVDLNLRVETDSEANALFVDGLNDNIGFGTNSPNLSSQLEMTAINKGLLINRVILSATNNAAPITTPATGLLVYNTATASTGSTAVSPGFYYCNGSKWIAMDGSNGRDWSLTGNAGTTAGTNFLGTTDAVSLVLSTDSSPRMVVRSGAGEVYVNNAGYFANYMLQSTSTGTQNAIGGFGSGTGDTYYGQNTGGGLVGRFLGTGDGFRSLSNSASGNGVQATGGAWVSYAYPGVSSGGVFAGTYGASGIGIGATSTGLAGLGQGRLTIVVDPGGSGIAGSGDNLGVFSYAGYGDVANANRGNASAEFILDADNDVTTTGGNNGNRARAKLAGFDNVTPDGSLSNRDSYYGGYFSGGSESSGTPSYAYVGMRYDTNGNGDGGGTDYKVIGTGSNSTLIDDPDGNPRIMFSPEAPEILFQDFGVGQLVNGQVQINIDPLLKGSIYIDREHPLKVYVTLEGECNGIYVTNKSADGFTVKELHGGTSNVAFSWQIVASRADRVAQNGTIVSKHVGVRLPIGPGQLAQKELKTETLIADKNYKIKDLAKRESVPSQTNNNQNNLPNSSETVKNIQKKN